MDPEPCQKAEAISVRVVEVGVIQIYWFRAQFTSVGQNDLKIKLCNYAGLTFCLTLKNLNSEDNQNRAMAQWVKGLQYTHDVLSLDSQNPHKNWAWWCLPGTPVHREGVGDRLILELSVQLV